MNPKTISKIKKWGGIAAFVAALFTALKLGWTAAEKIGEHATDHRNLPDIVKSVHDLELYKSEDAQRWIFLFKRLDQIEGKLDGKTHASNEGALPPGLIPVEKRKAAIGG